MAPVGSSVVKHQKPLETQKTEFALEGHRPCHACGYDLVGTPIERAIELDIAVIRCPECGTMNPLVGTPALGPFASRAATFLTLLRLLLLGVALILVFNFADRSVSSLGRSVFNENTRVEIDSFIESTGSTESEIQALARVNQPQADLGDLMTVLSLLEERNDRLNMGPPWPLERDQILEVVIFSLLFGSALSMLLLPQRWKKSTLIVFGTGLLTSALALSFLYLRYPLTMPVSNPELGPSQYADVAFLRMFAVHGAIVFLLGLVISSMVIRPVVRTAFLILVPKEHLHGVDLLWRVDGLKRRIR